MISPIIRDIDLRRRELRMSQSELAHAAGTAQSHISGILNGGINPTLPMVERLAAAVGLRLVLGYGKENPS